MNGKTHPAARPVAFLLLLASVAYLLLIKFNAYGVGQSYLGVFERSLEYCGENGEAMAFMILSFLLFLAALAALVSALAGFRFGGFPYFVLSIPAALFFRSLFVDYLESTAQQLGEGGVAVGSNLTFFVVPILSLIASLLLLIPGRQLTPRTYGEAYIPAKHVRYRRDVRASAVPRGVFSCPTCGAVLSEADRFCPACGATRAGTVRSCYCPGCGTEIAAGMKFCPVCGTGIEAEPSSPEVVMASGAPGHAPRPAAQHDAQTMYSPSDDDL